MGSGAMLSPSKPHLLIAAAIAGLSGPATIAISAQGSTGAGGGRTVAVALPARAGGQLVAFKSHAESLEFLQSRRDAVRAKANAVAPPPPPPPAPAAEAATASEDMINSLPQSRAASDKITNTQEADVDEGGIVKK